MYFNIKEMCDGLTVWLPVKQTLDIIIGSSGVFPCRMQISSCVYTTWRAVNV